MPSSRQPYWQSKFARNLARDKSAKRRLRDAGWDILIVWECQIRNFDKVGRRLVQFLLA